MQASPVFHTNIVTNASPNNDLIAKQFQFATRYLYIDNETSVLSSWSTLPGTVGIGTGSPYITQEDDVELLVDVHDTHLYNDQITNTGATGLNTIQFMEPHKTDPISSPKYIP